MKILIAHNFYQQPGGEDQCAAAEIAMLREFDHEVIEYFLHNSAIIGMSNLQVAARTIWNWQTYNELRQLLRRHRPQIAHFHNTFPLISPAAYYAARSENVKVVQTVHNFRVSCANGLFFRNGRPCEECVGKSVAWPAVLHKCYRQSRAASATVASMLTVHRGLGTWHKAVDSYIALTKNQRDRLIAVGLPPSKIAVKSNFAYPAPGPGTGSGGYAIYVGRLSAEKGVATLLEAWRHLDGLLPLRIVGDGPLAGAVQEAASRQPAVQWLGHRPLDEVYDLIGGAAALVLPSECYENFPRVIIEAFAKGTPVVASRLGAMAEIVDDGGTGLLFQPGSPSDLAAKIRDMIGSTAAAARMRRAARDSFDRRYTVGANHEVLMNIYERTINRRSQPERAESKRINEEIRHHT
jgi:glycosyltransferase involved in cell wall biosynthesis